ncbi:hypothetical protein [Streptomyces sp. SBT349]|uniref:hypothetical protein n=1 Tax=Streptomyces sp. SBT349 TaxID=1580539 RepID=UPI00066AED9D|nr:hypothetical protein [Streptomyces sp. SBT349]
MPLPSPDPLPTALPRTPDDDPQERGGSLVTRTLLITAPAVLAAAALRPRSRSGSRSGAG